MGWVRLSLWCVSLGSGLGLVAEDCVDCWELEFRSCGLEWMVGRKERSRVVKVQVLYSRVARECFQKVRWWWRMEVSRRFQSVGVAVLDGTFWKVVELSRRFHSGMRGIGESAF